MSKKQSEVDLNKLLGPATSLQANTGNKSISQLITRGYNQHNPECEKLQNKWPSFINECIARKKEEELQI